MTISSNKMVRILQVQLTVLLLIFASGSATEVRLQDSKFETFEDDLIFWALKKQLFYLHKTFAYYTDPADNNATSGNDLSKTLLFQSPWNGEVWTMATDYHAKRLYYSDHTGNFIGVYDLRTKEHTKLFQGMAWGIDSISVDWVSGNVYWTDSNFKWIMVADRNFSNYRNLLTIESDIPAKLAVHPTNRYIYWSEKRESDCRIWRSSLEGYTHELLHTFPEVETISDVTIDFANHRLYWAERLKKRGGISRIRYFSFRRSNHIKIVHEVYSTNSSYFFSLASYKGSLYVTDDLRKTMFVIDKTSNKVVHTYPFTYLEIPRGVAVFSKDEQPLSERDKEHECTKSPCEHICIARYGSNQFACECRTGFRIQGDGRTCKVDMIFDDFAILLDSTHSKLYQLNMGSPVEPQEIQVKNVMKPKSAAFNPENSLVYWADDTTRSISSASLLGENQKTLVKNSKVCSIALDVNAGNMYWVDSEKDAMYVSRMDGSHPHMLHVKDLHRVCAMTVDTKRGFLYWSDWGQLAHNGSQHGIIESSRMDGSDRRVLVKSASTPHGLALDIVGNTLFWTEIRENMIGWLNLTDNTRGTYRLPRTKRRAFPTGIAYYQNYVYVSDMSAKHLIRVSVADVTKARNQTGNTEEVRQFGPSMFYQLSAIFVYDSATAHKERSPCAEATCPHLCLPVHSSNTINYKCVCEDHYEYVKANNSCVPVTSSADDEPPTFGNKCLSDTVIHTDMCSDKALVNFTEPTATDNSHFLVPVKRLYADKPPMNLSEGNYNFAYTAMDRSGNKAICQFRIEVIVRTCYDVSLHPWTPREAVLSNPSCGNNVGSVVNVTCPEIPGIAFQYECQANQVWKAIGPETCEKQPTEPKSTTSAPIFTTSGTSTPEVISTTNQDPATTMNTIDDTTTNAIRSHGMHKKATGHDKQAPAGLVAGLVVALIILIAIIVAGVVILRRRNGKRIVSDRLPLTGSSENGIYIRGNQDSPFASQELPVLSSSDNLIL